MCTEGGWFDIVICRVVAVVAVVVLVLMFVAKEKIALWVDGHLWFKAQISFALCILVIRRRKRRRDKGKQGIEQLYQLLNNLFGVDCLVSK